MRYYRNAMIEPPTKTRRWFLFGATLIAALPLAACELENSYRQKLTITVYTPNGEVSGSSVIEIQWYFKMLLMPDGQYSCRQWGQPISVEVVRGRYVFGLLEHCSTTLAFDALLAPSDRRPTEETVSLVKASRKKVELISKLRPKMVVFDALNNSKIVKPLEPADFPVVFGAGYAFKSITLEITNEPVTKNRMPEIPIQ
jgi:hypothetical protein